MPLKVVSFESRRRGEMVRLIEKNGGHALVAPALQEVPLDQNPEALAFGRKVMAGEIHTVIFTTGVGVEALFDILESHWPREDLLKAFGRISLVSRGSKPQAALQKRGATDILTIDEPATGHQIVTTLDQSGSITGKTIAVQEYGSS